MAAKLARLHEIFSGGSASTSRRWSATAFFDKAIFANATVPPVYFKSSNTEANYVPGLPANETYDGVAAFFNHVILWRGDVLKWSDDADFSMWIPVSATAGSFVLTLSRALTQPALGAASDWVYVNEGITGMVVGQFLRTTYDPAFDYYEVSEVAPISSVEGRAINANQLITGANENIYTTMYEPWVVGTHIGFEIDRLPMKVLGSSINENFSSVVSTAFTQPAVNSSVVVALTAAPGFTIGQYVSLNTSAAIVGSDVYEVLGKNTSPNTLTLRRVGAGSQQQATGATYAIGTSVVSQPFVTVTPINTSDAPIFIDNLGRLIPLSGFKVKSLDLTGRSATGTVLPIGRQIFSIDANGAGETVNAGEGTNGSIWNFTTLSNIAYILKERSIQSVQFVGVDAGTFYFKPEVTDEGLLGRYSFKKIGEDKLFIFGHREFYQYSGGKSLVPIARQYSRQVLTEIDRARADEAVFHHNEASNEIWFIYFLTDGTQKIFIYNYVENSCTLDVWTDTVGDITAMNGVTWQDDVPWTSMIPAWEDTTGVWLDYVGVGDKARINMVGTTGKDFTPARAYLAEQGAVYLQDGAAYTSLCETEDFDWDQDAAFKYSDTLSIALQITQELTPRPFQLFVQIGARDSLDGDIRWTDARAIDVSGNGNFAPNINLSKGGRFHRIRFYSTDANTRWRISSFKLFGRKGNTY